MERRVRVADHQRRLLPRCGEALPQRGFNVARVGDAYALRADFTRKPDGKAVERAFRCSVVYPLTAAAERGVDVQPRRHGRDPDPQGARRQRDSAVGLPQARRQPPRNRFGAARRTLAELLSDAHYATVAQVAHENELLVYGEALEDHATWCAIAERYGPHWRDWPDGLSECPSATPMLRCKASRTSASLRMICFGKPVTR